MHYTPTPACVYMNREVIGRSSVLCESGSMLLLIAKVPTGWGGAGVPCLAAGHVGMPKRWQRFVVLWVQFPQQYYGVCC